MHSFLLGLGEYFLLNSTQYAMTSGSLHQPTRMIHSSCHYPLSRLSLAKGLGIPPLTNQLLSGGPILQEKNPHLHII